MGKSQNRSTWCVASSWARYLYSQLEKHKGYFSSHVYIVIWEADFFPWILRHPLSSCSHFFVFWTKVRRSSSWSFAQFQLNAFSKSTEACSRAASLVNTVIFPVRQFISNSAYCIPEVKQMWSSKLLEIKLAVGVKMSIDAEQEEFYIYKRTLYR